MASTVEVYKSGVLLGAGTCEADSATISSFVAEASRVTGPGRNVQLMITEEADDFIGFTWFTRVLADSVTSLTLADACPFPTAE